MKVEGATVHGRFRDWAGNVSSFPRENTEAALAHVIGDKAEQAYPRYVQPLQYAHPRPAGFHPERSHKLQPRLTRRHDRQSYATVTR
jgi:hypothetical protein